MGLMTSTAHLLGPVPPFVFAFPAVVATAVAWGSITGWATALLCVLWLHLPGLQPAGMPDLRPAPTAAAAVLLSSGLLAWFIGRRVRPAWAAPGEPLVRLRGAVALLSVAVLLPTAVFAIVAQRTYTQAFDAARLRTDRAARIVREHAGKVMDTNEVLIGRVEDMVRGLPDDEIRRRQVELQPRLAAFSTRLPQAQSIWLWGRDGGVLMSDRAPVTQLPGHDASDHARLMSGRSSELYVSEPVTGQATRQIFFDVSRARSDAPGAIGVALRPSYFEQFYAELVREEPGLSITLMRHDGTLLVRWPRRTTGATRATDGSPLMQAIDAGRREGFVTQRSAFDGKTRLIAFHAVDGYPLVAAIGLSTEGVLAAWRHDLAVFAAFFFPMAGALVAATWYAVRRARREHDALQALRGEVEQRVKAERALVQTQKLEALGQLTGSVAHDFNNLLAVVSNNAFLIERQTAIEKVGPLAAAIRRAVTTGTQLTRQLLAFSRHQPVRPQDVDLDEVLPNIVELLRTTVGSHISVALHHAADLRPVRVDVAELELALINLALNARHAMPQGGQLTVMARNAAPGEVGGTEAREHVIISVSDTGTGIAPEVLERVFEPFFTTKPEGQGSGLGLSQVYGTCSQVGGTARIESHLGLGTTVLMYLPTAERHSKPAPPPRVPDEPLNCRLLLVEDNAELAEATLSLLASFGVRAVRAADAEEALRLLRPSGHGFDIVLSDVVMPGPLNGLALAQRLRSEHAGLPVVLMTGYTSEIHKAVAAGFQVLPKPFVPEDLLNTLAAARHAVPA
jgi:signal transduction histidine kinase/CheY-like chemotaxis protein